MINVYMTFGTCTVAAFETLIWVYKTDYMK